MVEATEYLEPDDDGELLIEVTELPRFISVLVKGQELQVIYVQDPDQ